MFLTFTPNPCIERTLRLTAIPRGESQRIDSESVFVSAGGKGINAARVAARLGAKVIATGPIGKNQADWVRALAQSEGVANDFVAVDSDTRICLNVIHGNGQKTEILENGLPLSVEEGTQLLEKWRDLLSGARLASIGGSYPPVGDAGFDWHATLLCALAHNAGVPVIYDGRGEPFVRALASKTPPWAIKPNLEEASAYLRRDLETVADERRAVRDLLHKGVSIVLLSCGERGLYLGHKDGIEWFKAPAVQVVSPVGSGDSLVGAFAARWLEDGNLFEAARQGVAAGSACAAQEKPAFVSRADVELLLPQVKRKMQEISLPLV